MNCLSSKHNVKLLDLPDELILAIVEKGKSQISFLCSMIDIGNRRLEQLTFNKCHSIDFVIDYLEGKNSSLFVNRFYSHIILRIYDQIQSLTIHVHHIKSLHKFLQNNYNGVLPNLTHLKVRLCAKCPKTGAQYTIGNHLMSDLEWRKRPLYTIVLQWFLFPSSLVSEQINELCYSTMMRSIQSFQLDDNCCLSMCFRKGERRFREVPRLTDIRMSLLDLEQCIHLLLELGSQLRSFTVTIGSCFSYEPILTSDLQLISCPNLKQMKVTIYKNLIGYQACFSLLRCLSNIEDLTLLLAIGDDGIKPNYFIDECVLEKDLLSYMYCLHQFKFHIRSILKNVSHEIINETHQSFLRQQPFICSYDSFKNNYGQCQIYSLPFIGTRLDFVSNRFPLFNGSFSNVTTLLLFDDVLPFENIFFQRLAQALPRLRTLEIRNELEQEQKAKETTLNINLIGFHHLTTLILYDIHMDYAEQFLCQIHLSSLVELAIDKHILLTIVQQNHPQARDNCLRIGKLRTSEPSYEIIRTIQQSFPLADYVKHKNEY
ncbi:unnamed protein product [Adineta ricciae]|uniref:F-box domain-containing protein n=1 Tax=Adineta ricciae TaxID=249248 RepID=A0A815EBA5_ADIRI|nr:unnamed protein product [Adineta ricciae]